MTSAFPATHAVRLFALSDANSFYASAEQVFRPQLAGQPVIVLSNNDGCVIARSREAHAVPVVTMGAPVHTIQRQIREHSITVCSANFELYGDLSRRMLDVLGRFAAAVDPYSIDESFLDLTPIPVSDQVGVAERLRRLRTQQNPGEARLRSGQGRPTRGL